MNPSTLSITSMTTPTEAEAFQTLNEEWISQIFTMEASDRKTLDDPFGAVVDRGGDVLIVRDGEEIVGCVAVVPGRDGAFELSKMAVTPAAQGRGIGRLLVQAAVDRARELGAVTVFLGSSTKLPNAVHLYEAAGFQHVPADRIQLAPYVRADVFMELVL